MKGPTLFFDRSTGRKLPRLLIQMKPPFDVRYHDEKDLGFHERTPDDEWLAEVGKKGWVAISHDKRFHRDSVALEAIRSHQTAVFYMDAAQLTVWHKVQLLAVCHTKMIRVCEAFSPPFIWHMHLSGRVTRLKAGL